ncbi:MAG TPA: serine/threonine-protein kinase [Gemmatimonadaceae bacterium]|nr:serine/threonine-protein kinase [Gemmatimonadaceae bacterium]
MRHHDLAQIGKYQITELVGEGAMGVVYRAIDPVLSRPVAIKVMTESLAHEPEQRDRFVREAQTAGSLQHPNIVTIYDCGEVDGHPYIAMEYIEGADLAAILERHEPLPLKAKLDIAIDALSGLSFAHRHGVVHRDIKPANIRITEDGRAKLMDFGIAQLSTSSMTRTGVMMGTPNYMAPEQVMGEKTSPATDIFAFGAVLFELLTGSKLFHGPTLHNIFFKIVSEEAPSVRSILPGLPAALDHIVQRALAKDPKDRYPSALDMANDLSAVRAMLTGDANASTLSLRATISSTMASQRRGRRGKRMTWATWAAAGVLAAAGGTGWLVRAGTHGGAPPAADGAAPGVAVEVRRVDSAPGAMANAAGAPAEHTGRDTIAAPARDPARALAKGSPPGAPRATRTPSREVATVPRPVTSRPVPPAPRAFSAASADSARTDAAPAGPALAPLAAAPAPLTTAPAPAASQAPPPVSPPAPRVAPPTPPSPRVEIDAVVARYARAIASRDVKEVQRAYPGLTADQQRGFEQFFRAVRSLHADLALSALDVTGDAAQGRVTGAYEFVGSDGKSQRQPITFQAIFNRAGGAWELTAVR